MKIEFFSSVNGVAETYPVKPAQQVLPNWVAQARLEYKSNDPANLNIMRCPGIVDILRTGYVVTAWHDILVNSDGKTLQASAPSSDMEQLLGHPPIQIQQGDSIAKHLPTRPWSNADILKINTPWHIRSSVPFMMIPLPYTESFEFECCTGILDPSVSSEINIQGYINGQGNILIRAGTPLAQLVPMTDKKYTHEVRDANSSDLKWLQKRKYLNNLGFILNKGIVKNAYRRYFS
jgi:hypothetical protein